MPVDLNDPLGVDISCVDDVDASLELVDGNLCVGQAVARRIATPRGRLFYDRTYGADARGRIHRPFVAATIVRLVEQEAIKDERVEAASAVVTFVEVPLDADDVDGDARIDLKIVTAEGPFTLTGRLGATGVTFEEIQQERT